MFRLFVATLLGVFAQFCGVCAARFSIASAFSNGMVLQRDVPATIWGWTTPGLPVYGALLQTPNNTALWSSDVSDANGLWRLTFPPQQYTPAWGPTFYEFYASTAPLSVPCMTNSPVSCNGTTASIKQLLFGDVILCSGQVGCRRLDWLVIILNITSSPPLHESVPLPPPSE